MYLDWSKFPLVEESGTFGDLPGGGQDTQVSFRDLRFTYDVLFWHGRSHPPLSGSVAVAPNGQIDTMELDGRAQR